MDFAKIAADSYAGAVENGWAGPGARPVALGEACMLVVTEFAEAVECIRNKEALDWATDEGKPCGLLVELADAVIRMGHYATEAGIVEDVTNRMATYPEVQDDLNAHMDAEMMYRLAEWTGAICCEQLVFRTGRRSAPLSKLNDNARVILAAAFAHVLARIDAFFRADGSDIAEIVATKLAYNATRGNRHGH